MTNRISKLASLLWLAVIALVSYSCNKEDDEAVPPNQAPVALFTALPKTGTVGDTITMSDQSGDRDGKIIKWQWNFGDGTSSLEQHPKHVYAQAGDYAITLTVFDDRNDSVTYQLSVTINAFKELWSKKISESSISPSAPAMSSDGTLYFGSQDFKVYAVNPKDGTVKWAFETGGKVRSGVAVGDDGTIYAPSQDGKLYAITSNGSLAWSFDIGASTFNASPAIGQDGTIYFGADDNKVHALSSNGQEKWVFETGAKVRTDIIATSSTIYATSEDAKLYALSLDGSKKWEYEAGAAIKASPALGENGLIYFGDNNGQFYALDAAGNEKWVFTTADNNPFLGGPVIGQDGTLYIGTKRGPSTDLALFYAINPDGTERWKKEMPKGDEVEGSDQYYQNDILGTPTVGADGTIYFTFNDGRLYALNSNGEEKFTYKVATDEPVERWDQAIWTSPALTADGKLFFQDYSGQVYGLQVSASGLAGSPWPTRGANLKRTSQY